MPFYQFILTIREEIACLFILIYIAWTYYSVKRKNTYAHNLFSFLTIISIVNITMDAVTIYTVNNPDTVPAWLNRALHVIYIGTFPIILYTTYSYIKCLTFHIESHKVTLREIAPLIVACIGVAVLPMYYVETPYSNYSTGPADNVAYICAFIYFSLSIYLLVRYRRQLEKKALRGILTSLVSMVTVVVMQGIIEQLLITGIAVTLINVALFYTVESPDTVLIEKLAFETKRANEANKAKSSFLTRMSHELRTPINAILGLDEMILREAGEKNIRDYASDIQLTGRTLLSLINEILDYAKVDAGKAEIIPVQYEVRSLIDDLSNMTLDKIFSKPVDFNLEIDKKIPSILYGDEIRIRQVISNLLSNAVKYTDSGTVTLAMYQDPLNDVEIMLEIEVRDTGRGIREEDMDTLTGFASLKEESGEDSLLSTGLGIQITRQLLALMGSKLEVKSEFGEGSVFSFKILQKIVSKDPIGEYSRVAIWDHKNSGTYRELFQAPEARILAVDDTEINLNVFVQLLKKTQIVIDTAISGEDALILATEHEYDICFVDHMMPGMDGIETMHRLREFSGTKDSVFIVLTANAVSGAREMYIKAGFDDYLSKPVEGIRLEQTILQYLPAYKVKVMEETTEEEGEKKNDDALSLPGIDTEKGIEYCGSKESYMDVLKMFYETLDVKADEIEQYYNEGDIKSYRIKVHALKSSARIVGANELSQKALEMEEASDREDMDAVNENTAPLLELYRSFKDILSPLFLVSEDLPEADSDTVNEAYESILEFSHNMDYELTDMVFSSLSDYSLKEEDAKNFARLKELFSVLDYEGMIRYIEEMGKNG